MTTDRATLLALADRVEAATGPSRELDFAIFRVLHPEYAGPEWKEYGGGLRHINDGSDMRCLPPPNLTPSRWTASLDAALSLVSAGFVAALSELAADGLPGCCICTDTSASPPKYVWGVSYTQGSVVERLARATTAAAIRALAGKEQGK